MVIDRGFTGLTYPEKLQTKGFDLYSHCFLVAAPDDDNPECWHFKVGDVTQDLEGWTFFKEKALTILTTSDECKRGAKE